MGHPRYKDLQLTQLRTFCLVAARAEFAAAGEALGLSKATVWQQVRALERHLGAPLVRRHGRGIELTAEGRLLLELVQPQVGALDSLQRVFDDRRRDVPREFIVAATASLVSYHLPETVKGFAEAWPAVHLNLRVGAWAEVIEWVERGEADLGVTPYAADGPRSRQLDYELLFEMQFSVMTAADHPLARKRKIGGADLAAHPLIKPQEGSFSHEAVGRVLNRLGIADRVRWVMVSRSVDMTRRYAGLGVGVGLEYVGADAGAQMPELRVRPLDAGSEPLPVVLVTRKFGRLPEPADEFRRLLRGRAAGAGG